RRICRHRARAGGARQREAIAGTERRSARSSRARLKRGIILDHSCQVQRAPLKDHRGDFYDTPPIAVEKLLAAEREFFSTPRKIWEPAAGTGNIVLPLRAAGHDVVATDLNDRGCPDSMSRVDFLFPLVLPPIEADAIITNPPFSLALEFVELALERAP